MLSIFKKALSKGIVTKAYPHELPKLSEKSRGALKITRSCDGCSACLAACPTQALYYKSKQLNIDYGKCIFCGRCTDACPKSILKHTVFFELAQNDKKLFRVPLGDTTGLKHELNHKIAKMFKRSLQIRHLDAGSCNGCDWEMVAMTNPVHDLQRLGIDIVASPRHADILLVTGPVSKNLEQAVRMTYEATPAPKMVMAVGTCAIDGGVFKDSPHVLNGADKVIPVDIYVPGCPPRPEAIMYGLLHLLDKS